MTPPRPDQKEPETVSTDDALSTEDRLRDYLRRATADLRSTRRRLDEAQERAHEPVAIVGMGCRFPGGIERPQDLWDAAERGRDLVGPFPTDRGWDLPGLVDPTGTRPGTTYIAQGAFLDDVAGFDAAFFGISPREAYAMDPQQRILLEVAWSALEDARIDPTSLRGSSTGVYLGATDHDYGRGMTKVPAEIEGNVLIGRSGAVSSGRIAYVLGLHGPAITVDTMCSSSLVALHLAAAGLRRGDCDLAVTGGTTVMSTPEGFIEFSRQNALARDGRCKAFSASADGTGWAEGVGVLVLERLSDARRHGHRILAVVRGSAINQDGASNGLTAPNGTAQRWVIEAALSDAGLLASEVDHLEAHGTGTTLGDPIEAGALAATYGRTHAADDPAWLGSFKSNLGHAAAAAGVAGVIKTVMSLRAGRMARTLHVDEPTSAIDWDGGLRLLVQGREWPRRDRPRRGAVSAFGASGTNAHVILEEAPEGTGPESATPPADAGDPGDSGDPGDPGDSARDPAGDAAGAAPAGPSPDSTDSLDSKDAKDAKDSPAATGPDGPCLWLLSGADPDAVREQARRLAARLTDEPPPRPEDVAWSLATTRAALPARAAVVGTGLPELLEGLQAVSTGGADDRVVTGTATPHGRGPVFVFPGQGAQWAGMARALAAESPAFAARLQECSRAVADLAGFDIVDLLRGDDDAWLERVDVVQPALWAVMVALAAAWEAAGVVPAAVVGHSQGEIAAACVAGALSLPDAARVVVVRSAAIARNDVAGGMLSVTTTRGEAGALVAADPDALSLAAVNGVRGVVISGDSDALDALQERLEADGVRHRRVPVDYASHSPHVEPLRETLLSDLAGIEPRPTTIPLVSTVEGAVVDGTTLDPEYWYRNLREPVDLEAAVRLLAADGHDVVVEASPHPVLLPAIGDTLDDAGVADPVLVGSLRRGEDGAATLMRSVAELLVAGGTIDHARLLAGRAPDVVDLPTYPFQRRRYWVGDLVEGSEEETAPSASPAEEGFWRAVQEEDVDALTSALGADAGPGLPALLPALRAWHARVRGEMTVGGWRYRIDWVPADMSGQPSVSGRWIVVGPSAAADLGREVARALEESGGAATLLLVDDADLDRAALAERLRAAVGPDAADLRGLVSTLTATDACVPGHPAVPASLAGDLSLLQALDDLDVPAPVWVVTQNAAVADPADGPPRPHAWASWGLGRVAALERPERWGGLVDLPGDVGDTERARLAAVLSGLAGDEDQIAIRRRGALTRRLVRVPHAPDLAADPWTPPGCVLLVGGTGGIGRQVATRLARRGVDRLILAGRRGSQADGIAEVVEGLQDLGADVAVEAIDATDAAALAALRDRERDRGTPVQGVFHIAGAGELAPLGEVDLDGLEETVRAKIAGARALDAVFDGPEVTDVVLFSSISSIWGSGEHGAYAAANAYLDAVAEGRAARGLPGRSIAWGIWDPAAGGGMAEALVEEQLRARGVPFMDPDLALDALEAVLRSPGALDVVAEVDWPTFVDVFTAARPCPLLSGVPQAARELRGGTPDQDGAAGGGDAAALAALPAPQRADAVRALVVDQVAAALKFGSAAEVSTDRAFNAMGFDSLTSVDLRNRLGAATGLRLPATVAFDHPKVDALAAFVLARLFPDDDGAGAPSAGAEPVDPAEASVRAALATTPLEALEAAGLLQPLLDLASGATPEDVRVEAAAASRSPGDALDDLGVDDLVDLALQRDRR